MAVCHLFWLFLRPSSELSGEGRVFIEKPQYSIDTNHEQAFERYKEQNYPENNHGLPPFLILPLANMTVNSGLSLY